MNCLIYLRVSTQEQAKKSSEGEGYSIPAQRETCLKTIQENGWNFVDEYVDRGFSARSIRRPALQELLSRVKKDQTIDAVVVHKLDRLARNMEDHVAIRAILRKHNVQLVSVTENIEDTASGRLIEGIHALMAEFYSSNLAAETLKGMGQKAKQGGCPYRAPLGYKNVREIVKSREVRSVEIDQERAPFVKEAFKLYATGNYSLKELQRILTDKGLRTRQTPSKPAKTISVGVLASLLQNKFYIGLVNYKGVAYQGVHKPLISKDLFTRVQEVLRLHNLAGERKRKHPHYLKGTLYCEECGSRLSIDLAKGFTYFYCLGQKHNRGCKQPYVQAEDLEKQVLKLYKDIQLPQELIKELKTRLEKEFLISQEQSIREQKFQTRRLTKLTDERYKLMQAYYSEAIPLEVLKKEQERITKDVEAAEERLKILSVKQETMQNCIDIALTLASHCYDAYCKARPKYRQLFNQVFFKKIFVKNKKVSGFEYTEAFDYLLSKDKDQGSGSNKEGVVPPDRFERSTYRLGV